MQKIVFRKRSEFKRKNNSGWKLNADSWELVKISIVLLMAISGLSMLVGIYYWIKVDGIECQTQRGRCSPEMVTWLNGYSGAPAPLAAYAINREIQKQFGFVESVNSSIIWPATIKVETVLATPALTITTNELQKHGTYFTVTFEGVLMEKITSANDPILILDNIGTPVGKKLPIEEINSVQIAYHLASLGYKYQAKIVNSNLYVVIANMEIPRSAWFKLSDNRTPAELVNSLAIILHQSSLANSPIVVDLRYDRPVVREMMPEVAGESTFYP